MLLLPTLYRPPAATAAGSIVLDSASGNDAYFDGVGNFAANSQALTFSVWLDPVAGFDPSTTNYIFSINGRSSFQFLADGRLRALIQGDATRNGGTGNFKIIYETATTYQFAPGSGPIHYYFSADLSDQDNPVYETRLGGVLLTDGVDMTITEPVIPSDYVTFARTYGIFARFGGNNKVDKIHFSDLVVSSALIPHTAFIDGSGNPVDPLPIAGSAEIVLRGDAATLNGATPNAGTNSLTKGLNDFADAP